MSLGLLLIIPMQEGTFRALASFLGVGHSDMPKPIWE